MMRIIWNSSILACAFLASLAAAHTPFPLPPDPLRLSEALRLVDALPLDKVFEERLGSSDIAGRAADDALEWMSALHPENQDDTLRQVFHGKVRLEARRRLGDAINDARTELAMSYARRLSLRDLESARIFAITQEGRTFMELQIERDAWLQNLIRRKVYDRLHPDLPQFLEEAQETVQVMNRINSKS